MPITNNDGVLIPLRNELSEKDFEWRIGDWLYAHFTSPYLYFTPANDPKDKLATFLNEKMRGPYYVHETNNQGHGASGQLLHVIIMHPSDRQDFADQFVPKSWREVHNAVAMNADVIGQQMACGFQYENTDMAVLIKELNVLQLPIVPQAFDIDSVATRVWKQPRPLRLLAATTVPRNG